jgi:hypothetical protein
MTLDYPGLTSPFIDRYKEITTVTLIGIVWRSFYDAGALLLRAPILRQAE